MQFLPNKSDIYIAALKSALLRRFGKDITPSRADMLKRLWLCAAMNNRSSGVCTDISAFAFELSAAITARLLMKGYAVFAQTNKLKSGIINKRAFEVLLCIIADECKIKNDTAFIKMEQDDNFLKITARIRGNERYIKAAVKAMNGFIISAPDRNRAGIFIPTKKTEKRESTAPVISSAEYITDPYSAINLFLKFI